MDTRDWAYTHSILGRFDWDNVTVWDPDHSGNRDTLHLPMPGMVPCDTSYGTELPPEEQTSKYHHGLPIKTAVAVIQSGRLVRGCRVLDHKFGCFSAKGWKALEYAFPSIFDKFSHRKYQLVFTLKVTRVWNSKKANPLYFISRENDISITGLIVKFWGRGYCCQLLAV